jgi:tetratricopeptide (TPR) repeat protein
MSQAEKCPICGRPLPMDAPRKLCPACLFEGVLASGFAVFNDAEPAQVLSTQPRETGTASRDPAPGETGTIVFETNRIETRITASDHGFALPTPSELFDAPVIPGYTIIALLGAGGMGVVYEAIQTLLKRTVALKMIRGGMGVSNEQLGRFRLEAEAVARVRHPNIVQIYEVGTVGGLPYFSLEMLEGGTLAARLEDAPMPTRPAAELAMRLARGVAAVHQVGIVHRDLKPANVLFDVDGTPKISDFGLAKQLEVEEGPTVSGQVMGTPSYMAPEQAQGLTHQVGPAADIYALGAILYEVLTGRPPFKGTSMMETLHQVVYEDVVPPSRFQSKVSRDLETICLKCLAKEPSRRYGTAAELADDLGRLLAGEAILARPTPVWERAAKWARRRPATAAMIAVSLVLAIGVGLAAERYAAYQRGHAAAVNQLRLDSMNDLERGLRQRADGNLDDARVTFAKLHTKLDAQPELTDIRDQAAAELSDVNRRLAAAAGAAHDRKRFTQFRQLRDDALQRDGKVAIFPALLQSDLDAESSPVTPAGEGQDGGSPREAPWKQIREIAAAALEVFPLDTNNPASASDPIPGSLAPEQRAEIEADRYLLLLVQSEAVALPLPGEDPKRQADLALRLLDRAGKLRSATAAYHLRRAACLVRRGDLAAAKRERDLAAGLDRANAFDRLLLGREHFTDGDWPRARKRFEESLRLKPDSFWAHCWLAIADLNIDPPRAEEAKGALTTCLIQQPSYAWLYLARGSAYQKLGFAAQDSAARWKAKGPEFALEAETRFENAEADFRAALEKGLDEGFRFVLMMNRGTLRYRREQWEAAAADFTQAIALEPRRYNGYASLAQTLRKLGRSDLALEQMSRAITLEPTIAALHRGRALTRLDSGALPADQAEQVLRDLEASARLEPRGSADAAVDHVRRGRLLLDRARPQEALAAADAALAIAPDLPLAHVVRVAALLQTERYDDVIDSCDVALARGAATAELYRVRGLARAARNDFAGAIDDYTQGLALRPEDPAEVHRNRGWSHLFVSAFALAERDFNTVLQIAPGDTDGYAGRGAARVRLGRIREAVADAEESLRPGVPSPRLLYVAAQTYAQASSRAAAEVTQRGRSASRDSLSFEARSAALLRQALERTPAERRSSMWRDVVAQDTLLRPLLHNPRIIQWLKPRDGSRP